MGTLTRTIPVLDAMIANDLTSEKEDMTSERTDEVDVWYVSGSKPGTAYTVNLNTATCTCYYNCSTRIPCKHIFHILGKDENKSFDDLVPIIDEQTPHLTLDYDVIEKGTEVPRKSDGSLLLHAMNAPTVVSSLTLSTMPDNVVSSHDNDCLGWEVCSEAGQGGTQEGHDECLDDTCDLENDYQSGNDDYDEDDNFTPTLTSAEKDTRSLQAVVSTLHDLQNTLRQDPNYVFTKPDRVFLKGST